MSKSAVYSWRLSPELKLALTEAAKENRQSLAELLERIAQDWLVRFSTPGDDETQRRLHAEAARHLGAIDGGDSERATNARQHLRARLAHRREHSTL